jgi:hypothetical protein
MEQEKANEHIKYFEDTKTKKLPKELVNTTDRKFKHGRQRAQGQQSLSLHHPDFGLWRPNV